MNKVFKVLWNKARQTHVVTDETKRALKKGKSRTALLLTGALLAGGSTTAAFAAITTDAGWTHTTITTTGKVTDVTTNYVKDKIAVNHFDQFTVNADNIANLHQPVKADNLVNFVNQGVDIQGTVNALKDRAGQTSVPGGDLLFVTPKGFTVGKTGVVNAGSLTSVVTTEKAYSSYTKKDGAGNLKNLNADLVKQMKAAEVPLNPAGVITVEGSINTGNRVMLAASTVNVKAGGKIRNTITATEFGRLVNLGDTADKIAASPDVPGMKFRESTDGSGDIVLVARSQTMKNVGEGPTIVVGEAEAKITVAGDIESRENVKMTALAGAGDYNFDYKKDYQEKNQHKFTPDKNKHTATVTADVTVSGKVTAKKDLTVKAEALNRLGEDGIIHKAKDGAFEIAGSLTPFNFDYGFSKTDSKATVTIDPTAQLIAGDSLTLDALTVSDMVLGADTAKLKFWGSGNQMFPSAATTVAIINAESKVAVKSGATLKTGGDLTIKATDRVTADTHANAVTMLDDASHIALNVTLIDAKAAVDVEKNVDIELTAPLTTKQNVTVSAEHTSDVTTEAVSNQGDQAFGSMAFNYTQHDTDASVALGSDFGTRAADSITVTATNETETEKTASMIKKRPLDMVIKLNETLGHGASREFVAGLTEAAGLDAIDSNFSKNQLAANVRAAIAVGVITGEQSASVTIGNDAGTFKSTGDMTVASRSVKKDHSYHVESNEMLFEGTKLGGALSLLVEAPGPNKTDSVSSDLTIGDNNILEANGRIDILNRASIDYARIERMHAELMAEIDILMSRTNFGSGEWDRMNGAKINLENAWAEYQKVKTAAAFGTFMQAVIDNVPALVSEGTTTLVDIVKTGVSYAQPSSYLNAYVTSNSAVKRDENAPNENRPEPAAASGSIAVLTQKVDSNLVIGKKTIVRSMQDALNVIGESRNTSVSVSGNVKNMVGIPVPQHSGTGMIGASVFVRMMETDNLVRVQEGTLLHAAKNLTVAARDSIDNIAIGASADVASGKLGLEANAVASINKGLNRLSFDDEAKGEGANVMLEASRTDNLHTIAGALSVNSSKEHAASAVAAGIAIATGDMTTSLKIHDNDLFDVNDKTADGAVSVTNETGFLVAGLNTNAANTGNLSLDADQDTFVNTVGASVGVAKSGESAPNGFTTFLGKAGGFFKDTKGKLFGAVDSGLFKFVDMIPPKMNELGKWIGKAAEKPHGENSSDSPNLDHHDNDNGLGKKDMGDTKKATTRTDGTSTPTSQGKGFQIALAASVGWNDTDLHNGVELTADSFKIDAKSLNATALQDKFVGTWAGSAGVNVLGNQTNHVSSSAAVGGAVAVNTGDSSSVVNLKGATSGSAGDLNIHGLLLTNRVDDVKLLAMADGATVAEGIAGGISFGTGEQTGSQYGLNASISVNLLETKIENTASGVTQEKDPTTDKATDWSQTAWTGEYQITGGTGLGFAMKPSTGQKSGAIGAIVAVAQLDNTVSTSLTDTKLAYVNNADVSALASVDQWTTALSLGMALGDQALTLTGAASAADIDNTVTAEAKNVDMNIVTAGGMSLVARDVAGAEEDAFHAIADSRWDKDLVASYNPADVVKQIELETSTDRTAAHRPDLTVGLEHFAEGRGMTQQTLGISLGYSGGSGAGAGIVVNDLDNVFRTTSDKLTLTELAGQKDGTERPELLTQASQSGVFSLGVASGVAASAGANAQHFAAAGAVVVGNVNQVSETNATDVTVDGTKSATVYAGNEATTVNVAGELGLSLSGTQGHAAGASVVVMNTNDKADVNVKELTFEGEALNLNAYNRAAAWSASAGAQVASGMAMGGSVSVNRMMNDATVDADGLSIKNAGAVKLTATDRSELWSLAGQVVVATSGYTGIGGAVAYAISGREEADGTRASAKNVEIFGDDSAKRTDLCLDADAEDSIMTLSLAAGVAPKGVGLAGAAGANEVKRQLNATLENLTTSGSGRLGRFDVKARESSNIGNIGLVVAEGTQAAVGLGLAVNRIQSQTDAVYRGLKGTHDALKVKADTMDVSAISANRISTIGIGGSVATGTAAVSGSVGVNLIDNRTGTRLENVNVEAASAAQVVAQSDDTIGAYVGELTISTGTAAVGLSVLVNESEGYTEAALLNSSITETGAGDDTLTYAGEVTKDDINTNVVNEIDINARLGDRRREVKTEGIRVAASSTTNYKSLVINGAGAATAAMTGTAGVTYDGGHTAIVLDQTKLKAKDNIDVTANNAVNVDNVSSAFAGSSSGAGNIAVNVATTDHLTNLWVDGGSLETEGDLTVAADGKEGVSSLAVASSFAFIFSGGAITNVTRELSDVETTVAEHSNVVMKGRNINVTGDYLGRYNSLAVQGSAGEKVAGTSNVSVNYGDNNAVVNLGNAGNTADKVPPVAAELRAIDSINVSTNRTTENSGLGTGGALALYASLGSNVLVNTIEGRAETNVNVSTMDGRTEEDRPDITVTSNADDSFKFLSVGISGSIGAVNSIVVVNSILSDAATTVYASDIAGGKVDIDASRNRFIDVTTAKADVGAVSLGANVVVNTLGTAEDPFFDENLGQDLADISEDVNRYVDEYGSAYDPNKTTDIDRALDTLTDLTPTERATVNAARHTDAKVKKQKSGTKVKVSASNVTGTEVNVKAEENTKEGAGVTVDLGSGSLGGLVLSGSVSTLRENRNLLTEIGNSRLTATKGGTIGTEVGGKSRLTTYQNDGSLISGKAAYSYVDVKGGSLVNTGGSHFTNVNTTDLSPDAFKPLRIAALDKSDVKSEGFGIGVSGISGGAVIGDLMDATTLEIVSTNDTMKGKVDLAAERAARLAVETTAGWGGSIVGVGSRAYAESSGNVSITTTNLAATGDSLSIKANNAPEMQADAYQAYASVYNAGIQEADLVIKGKTTVAMDNTAQQKLDVKRLDVTAASGLTSEQNAEALRMTAKVESFGAQLYGGHVKNRAGIENTTETTLSMTGLLFGNETDVSAVGSAASVYEANAQLGDGGAVAVNSNQSDVKHGAKIKGVFESEVPNIDVGQFSMKLSNVETDLQFANGAGGGVIDTSAGASWVGHADTSRADLTLKGNLNAKSIDLGVSSTQTVSLDADNTKGTVVGGSAADVVNSMQGANTLDIAGQLNATGDLSAKVTTSVTDKMHVKSQVYGGAAGTGTDAKNTIEREGLLTIADDSHIAAASVILGAQSKNDTRVEAVSASAGAVSGVTAWVDNKVSETNRVNIGHRTDIISRSHEKDLIVSSSGDTDLYLSAQSEVQGAAVGGAGSDVDNVYTRTNEVNVAKLAALDSGRDLKLFAGRNFEGTKAHTNATLISHAYSHTLIGAADPDIRNAVTLKNRLNVAGDATATVNIEGAALSGTWKIVEHNRQWALTAGKNHDVKIVTSADVETISSLKEENAITVDGALTAGTKNVADIVIEGIVNPSASDIDAPTFVGGSDDVTITVTGEGGLIEKVDESIANIYFDRYTELQKFIADYSASGEAEKRSLALAYRSEADFLKQKMIAEGLAEVDQATGILKLVKSEIRRSVKVSDVVVSGGNIRLESDEVTGGGEVRANAADRLSIDNRSNLGLIVKDVSILEKGGDVTLNGVTLSGLPDFDGTVTSGADHGEPQLTIKSAFEGSLKTTDANGQSISVKPDVSIRLEGLVENDSGSLAIQSADDILIFAERVGAASTIDMLAGGTVFQSHTSGIMNLGPRVETLWDDWASSDHWNQAKWHSDEFRESMAGRIVAGGDIFFSADNLNVNGTVQSGYAHWGLQVKNFSHSTTQSIIERLNEKWLSLGSPENIDPFTADWQMSREQNARNSDGTYSHYVASYYDPVHKRIVINKIEPRGGQIFLNGRISNTGAGKLYAANGRATVQIDAHGYDIQLGDISTGHAAGLIKITDTMWSGTQTAHGKADALVTTWENSPDGTKMTRVWQVGNKSYDAGPADINTYNPMAGLHYMWATGTVSGTEYTSYEEYSFKWWEAWNSDKFTHKSETTTVHEDANLGYSPVLGILNLNPGEGHNFMGTSYAIDGYDSGWTYEAETIYDNWTHFSGLHIKRGRKTVSDTIVHSFAVKADHPIQVKLMSGENLIDVKSTGSIYLGGELKAQDGTVNLAAAGSILNASGHAAIHNAKSVSLSAENGQIGRAGDAIRISGVNRDVALKAEAATDLFVIGDANLHASALKAKNLVLATGDNLSVDSLIAQNAKLGANRGGITVTKLEQTTSPDNLSRFDAKAAGHINITSATDLGIGVIETPEDVTIKVDGELFDALPRVDLDNRSAEEKLAVWQAAGLLDGTGESLGAERFAGEVAAAEEMIRVDYRRYLMLREKPDASLTEADRAVLATLTDRFAGVDTTGEFGTVTDELILKAKNDPTSELSKIIAAEDKFGWTKNELLYAVSDAIVNPKPDVVVMPGEPNIKARNVSIATTKSLGKELGEQVFAWNELDFTDGKNLELLKLLARADVNDVLWKDGESVTIDLKRPISVDNTGTVSLTSGESIFVDTEGMIDVSGMSAKDQIRLTATEGITQTNPDSVLSAMNITLRGGTGSIGSADKAVNIDTLGGWLAVSSGESVYINETTGDLRILAAGGGDVLSLSAENILMAPASGHLAQGEIQAKTLKLKVKDGTGRIGSDTDALRIRNTPTVEIENSTLGGIWLESIGEGELRLVADTQAAGAIDVTSEGALNVNERKLAAETIMLEAGKSLTGNAAELTADETLTMKAEDDLILTDADLDAGTGGANLTAKSALKGADMTIKGGANLDVLAQSIDLSKADLETAGKITLAAVDTLTAPDACLTAGGAMALTAKQISMPRTVVTATGMTMKAEDDLFLTDADLDAGTGDMNLTAQNGSLELAVTEGLTKSLKAKDIRLQAADSLAFTNRQVTATGAVMAEAGTSIAANGLKLDSETLEATALAGGLSMQDANLAVTGDTLTLKARDNVLLERVAVTSPNADILFESETGRLGLSGMSDLSGKSATLLSKADMALDPGLSITTDGGSITLKTEGGFTGENIALDSGKDLTIEAGRSMTLAGATIDAAEGALKLLAGTRGSAPETMTLAGAGQTNGKPGEFTAKSIQIETTGRLETGGDSLRLTATAGNAVVGAESAAMKSDAHIKAEGGDAVLELTDALETGEGFAMSGQNVRVDIAAGALSLGDGSTLAAEADLSMTAKGDISLKGYERPTTVDARGHLKIASETGDVTFDRAVKVGSRDAANVRTEKLTLSGKNILQTGTGPNRSLIAKNLEATAGGNLVLGSVGEKTGDAGNEFEHMMLESGGDAILGMKNADNSTLSLNAVRNGLVNGNFILHAAADADRHSSVTILNSLQVEGQASLYAGALKGDKLTASAHLDLSTAAYDRTAEDGIDFNGLEADRLMLLTEKGSIRVGSLKSRVERLSVVRRSTTLPGTFDIADGYSPESAILFNGAGDMGGRFYAEDNLWVATGDNPGQLTIELSVGRDRVSVQTGQACLLSDFVDDFIRNRSAETLLGTKLGMLALPQIRLVENLTLGTNGIADNIKTTVKRLDALDAEPKLKAEWLGRNELPISDHWTSIVQELYGGGNNAQNFDGLVVIPNALRPIEEKERAQNEEKKVQQMTSL